MRAQCVDWFLHRPRSMARIPASDDDNDLITGVFLVRHEVDGMSEWQVRDGRVEIRAASRNHRCLDEWCAGAPGRPGSVNSPRLRSCCR